METINETNETNKAVLIAKHHDITAFASKDPTRFAINAVHYNAEKGALEATDGRTLIRVPVCRGVEEFPPVTAGNEHLEDCLIRPETLKKGLANIPKGQALPVRAYAQLSGTKDKVSIVATDSENEQAVTGKTVDANFPALDRVIPDPADYPLTIALSPTLLKRIAEYVERHGKDVDKDNGPVLRLQFKDGLSPVLWSAQLDTPMGEECKAEGVLVPMRLS